MRALQRAAPLLLLVLMGCLPTTCSRTESTALMPADSLSRSLAVGMTPDTLTHVESIDLTDEDLFGRPMAHPQTVEVDASGATWIADVETGWLVRIGQDGAIIPMEMGPEAYPYLAGASSTSSLSSDGAPDMWVWQAGNAQLVRLDAHLGLVSRTEFPLPEAAEQRYVYAVQDTIYMKRVVKDGISSWEQRTPDGVLLAAQLLPGPFWYHAGFVRAWGDRPVSLAGYRPMITTWLPAPPYPGGEVSLDSMALVGFDSPVLARRLAFVEGRLEQPPLLSSSARALEDQLFVLNLRPGWLQVDVYDRSGRLLQVLTEPDPAFNRDFFPVDLAVSVESSDETTSPIRIDVLVWKPEPSLRRYRWTPQGSS